MVFDPKAEGLLVGVVGGGQMGRGIVQVAAQGGCRVKLFEARPETAKEAVAFVGKMLARAAEKGQMSAADAEAATARIEIVDGLSGLADCPVVIEAIIENLEVKHAVFKELEAVVSADAVLASNTSSLTVASIAAACEKTDRIVGFHFFNPVPLMKLVEVIDSVTTAPDVGAAMVGLGRRFGREPVRMKDAPGFLVNQVGRGYNIETAHIAADGVASFSDFDRILRDAAGFRMGPVELMDLTAIDVTHPATEFLFRQTYNEPRYRPATLMQMRLDAGLLGRKVGLGFYSYVDGKKQEEPEAPAPSYDGRPVWISPEDADGAAALREIVAQAGGKLEEGAAPSDSALILVTPIGSDATSTAVAQGLDATRTIAVDTVFGLTTRRTIMKTPVTAADVTAAAHGLLGGGSVHATVIGDTPGFVAQRAVAAIINISSAVAQSGMASPADIDKAVVLGLNFPHGPLAWADALGPAKVLQILEGIQRVTGDPRYRPSPWLRRRAQLGVSMLTPES